MKTTEGISPSSQYKIPKFFYLSRDVIATYQNLAVLKDVTRPKKDDRAASWDKRTVKFKCKIL